MGEREGGREWGRKGEGEREGGREERRDGGREEEMEGVIGHDSVNIYGGKEHLLWKRGYYYTMYLFPVRFMSGTLGTDPSAQ